MILRHDQKMDRGMGVNILEYRQQIILIIDFCRFLSPDDLTKGATLIHSYKGSIAR